MSARAASTAAARTAAPATPRPRRLKAAPVPGRRVDRPARPRRVSGPTRRQAPVARPGHARTTARKAPIGRGLAARAGSAALRLPDHALLDRLVRGRYWIGIIGAALIGMVAVQVAMLRINSDIGRYVMRASSLERANSVIAAENSRLAAVARIEAEGTRLGLVLPHSDGVRFLYARPDSDAVNAVATMKARNLAPVTQTAATTAPASPGTTTTTATGTTPTTGTGTTPTTGATGTGTATGAGTPTTPGQGTQPGAQTPPAGTTAQDPTTSSGGP